MEEFMKQLPLDTGMISRYQEKYQKGGE